MWALQNVVGFRRGLRNPKPETLNHFGVKVLCTVRLEAPGETMLLTWTIMGLSKVISTVSGVISHESYR